MTAPDAIRWSDPPKSRQAGSSRAGRIEPQEVGKFDERKVRLEQSGGGEETLSRFYRRMVASETFSELGRFARREEAPTRRGD